MKLITSTDWFKRNNLIILSIIILSKFSISLFTLSQDYKSEVPDSFALCSGDCISYISPIENLVNSGHYHPDYRMPGYGIIYLPLYILFSKPLALNFLVIIQILLDIMASYLFVKSIWLLSMSKWITLAGMIFYGIGITVTVYNKYILTESVAASFLIISFYHLIKYKKRNRTISLILASFFMVWAYFCRPIMFPIFILQLLYIVHTCIKSRKFFEVLYFILPFLIIQGSWTLRNYIKKEKFYLLTEIKYYPHYPSSVTASWDFIKTFDDMKSIYFFPDGDYMNRSIPYINVDSIQFPDYIYTPEFNEDSLLILRGYAKIISSDTIPKTVKNYYNKIFTEKINLYTRSVKEHHPLIVHVNAPLKRIYKQTFKASGVQFLFMHPFSTLPWYFKSLKLFYILIYQIALYSSIIFILTFYIHKDALYYLLTASCVYGILVHPVIIGTSDVRYLYTFYPLIAYTGTLFFLSFKNLRIFDQCQNYR